MEIIDVLPKFPALYWTWRQELASPFRRCDRALVLRLSPRRAVVLGRWAHTGYDEDEAAARVFGVGPSPVGGQR